MDKKKIDIEENIIDAQQFLPEDEKHEETQHNNMYIQDITSTEGESLDDIKDVESIIINNKIKRKHRRRVIIGAVMVFLMAVGVVSIVATGVGIGKKMFDNTKEKQKYNELLATLVVNDPLPFETIEQADQDIILASSVWAAVINENMDRFEKDDFGQTYLPAVEVDKYYAKVFGTQHTLQHRNFTNEQVEFIYNPEKQAYAIPQTGLPTGFTPQVEKIKNKGKTKIVTVGYISPASSWADVSDGAISKYVDYVFQKQGANYALVAIRESDKKVEIAAR